MTMQRFAGQGATESSCRSDSSLRRRVLHLYLGASRTTARTLLAQGATEYLVLLAVVLIIALVAIALLGFFPGTASDAQIAESQIYWQSQSPIVITEMAARRFLSDGATYPYLRIRNNGQHPIRITKVLGENAQISTFYCDATICGSASVQNLADYYYLGPGEESYFAWSSFSGTKDRQIAFYSGTSPPTPYYLPGVRNICAATAPYGTLTVNGFGFEYVQYVEGQQITKREIGSKPLIIKCREPL